MKLNRSWSDCKYGLFLIAVCMLSSGCALHQIDPTPKPLVELPSRFIAQDEQRADSLILVDGAAPWWLGFGDPVLEGLVTQALSQNFDLQAALARLVQAREVTHQARSPLFPELTLEGRSDGEIDSDSTSSFSTLVGPLLSWELDFFQRNYSDYVSKGYLEQATEQDLQTAKLVLTTFLADTYYQAVEQKRQLALLQAQVEVDRELLELVELRFQGGLVSTVDVLQQRGQVAETESLIPLAEARLYRYENQIDALLGAFPDGVARVNEQNVLPTSNSRVSVALPVSALLNRPDIAAERMRLVAADAEIGRAIADRFPRLVIEGGYGYAHTNDDSGFAGTLQSFFTLPLLDWGRRRAEVDRSRALYAERLARFSSAVINAVREVEDILFILQKQVEFVAKLEARRDILAATVEESRARYSQGLTDYLPVLDALQELREIERQVLTEQRQLVAYRVQLHRAIGGPMESSTKTEERADEKH